MKKIFLLLLICFFRTLTINAEVYAKIEQEGEDTWDISDYTPEKCHIDVKTVSDKQVHKGSYVRFSPISSRYSNSWYVTYKIPDVISGKYKVHVVTLSKTIDTIEEEKIVQFNASINYYDQSGELQVYDCGSQTIETDDYVDKVNDKVITEMEFPVSHYGQISDVTITIAGNANPKKKAETSIMYLDYIYLEPVYHDEGEAEEVIFPDVMINDTNFPDENFRNWILAQSYGSDGVLTSKELASVRNINVSNKNIQSLKGIEYFYALMYLDCCTNQLTSLDVSQNTMLTSLFCFNNQLTALDVSQNTALNSLSCGNNQLSSLNVSGCISLRYLYCPYNQLYSLDVSKNTVLTWLGCYNNQLTSLDLSKNIVLKSLQCNNNQLKFINMSGGTELEKLSCYSNLIDIEAMDALVASLPNVNNGIMQVIYSENEGNVMTNTNVDAAKEKGWIPQYYNNGWKEYKGVIGINETNFPDGNFRNWILSQSYGSDRVLTSKEISGITRLDVSSKYIKRLRGIEYFTALTELSCYNNQINYSAMNELLECLPTVRNGRMYVVNNAYSGDAMTTSQVEVAKAKGWTPMGWNSGDYSGCDSRGDANGDYNVDMSDVMYVVNYILGKTTDTFISEFADVNGDGKINMTDVMFSIWKINKGKYPDEEVCFYLGATEPTAKNYLSLPDVVTSYTSIDEALETTSSVSAGETIYMICPTNWMRGREVYLKDENGKKNYFSDEIDSVTISKHSIYKTQVFDGSKRLKLENMYLPDLMEKDPTISIFCQALKLTNMADSLTKYIDNTYYVMPDSVKTGVYRRFGGKDMIAHYNEKRYFKYTAFVETNEILSRSGINSIEDLIAHAKAIYDETFPYDAGRYDGDYTNRKNPLNRWVSYHMMNRYGNYEDWAPYGQIYEQCCRPDVADAEDFWQTMMNEGMIRFCRAVGQLYANRKGLKNEVSEGMKGVRVLTDSESGDINMQALNGRYFYLDDLLEYSTDVRDKALNCRMRIDATTLSADFMNQGARGNLGWDENYLFAFKGGYIDGWKISPETFVGVHCDNPWWSSYLGNVVVVKGQYDVQIKLPNPPQGLYEIRLAYVASEERGVVQVYFNDVPYGEPIDMRRGPWNDVDLSTYDMNNEEDNQALDKTLRNLGYMLGPDSYGKPYGGNFRVNAPEHIRRILITDAYFAEGQENWLRFQQLQEDAEWSFDYIELCPKSVYDSPEGEDRH